jgi:hypothetical protein
VTVEFARLVCFDGRKEDRYGVLARVNLGRENRMHLFVFRTAVLGYTAFLLVRQSEPSILKVMTTMSKIIRRATRIVQDA